jgi:hypothetical protein
MKTGRDIWVVYSMCPRINLPRFCGAFRDERNADKVLALLPGGHKEKLRIQDKNASGEPVDIALVG